MDDLNISPGFEAVHAEWIKQGGRIFRQPSRAHYKTPYWTLVKAAVFKRDSFKCFRCQGQAIHVHHLTYDFTGEEHLHPECVISVCRECHSLVEYARKAEAVISRMHRRISLLKHTGDFTKTYIRLIEYREELSELRIRYDERVPYESSPAATRESQQDRKDKIEAEDARRLNIAKVELESWNNKRDETSARLIVLLELEIKSAQFFANEVLKPI